MAANAITFTEKIVIERTKEQVWDYTQNSDLITEWDKTVLEATTLEQSPKTVKLKMKENVSITYVYKLENRPNKFSLTYRKVESSVIEHGGITGTFEERSGTTLWIQTCTMVFKRGLFMGLRLPYYRWKYGLQIRKAMQNAKEILENMPVEQPEQGDVKITTEPVSYTEPE
ncbi:MAG TPA: hypothetical protein PL009_12150 [Flavipsychrobacter sp.]|nr:hypothetical protein [Flavipsychrobacter sp.]